MATDRNDAAEIDRAAPHFKVTGMRILHSADWQLGKRFPQFGARAARLGEARLQTFRRVLGLAAEHRVDALLIAGDLFEDHQIEPKIVAAVYELLAAHPAVPVLIAPGNHDPIGRPSAIWARTPFAAPPPHVKVFAQPETVRLGAGWLLVNPLTQKQSTVDPSERLAELARGLPADEIKIGMTHGSPAIPSMHQPDDFPITITAATRAGLDFLALGHWHSELLLDGGRLLMPGTPEPTSFEERGAGSVHLVEIEGAGARPRITRLECAELKWLTIEAEWSGVGELGTRLGELAAANIVLRLRLRGLAAAPAVEAWRVSLQPSLEAFAACAWSDETAPDISGPELAELERNHPLLTQVLADLERLATQTPGAEAEALEKRVGGAPGDLAPPLLEEARRVLLRELREATAC